MILIFINIQNPDTWRQVSDTNEGKFKENMALFATTLDTQRCQAKGVTVFYSYYLRLSGSRPAALRGLTPQRLQRDI
jgi:hypothetical protein